MADLPVRPCPSAERQYLATGFTLAEVSAARRDIEAASRRCGLAGEVLDDWITAVNELMINAVRHGGGRGAVRLFSTDRLTCEVADRGSGFNASRYVPVASRPVLSANGGMGLWMVGTLAEFLFIDSGPAGTTIRIAVRSPAGAG